MLKIEAKSNKHMYYAKKSDKAQQDHILVSWNVKVPFFSCYLYLPLDVHLHRINNQAMCSSVIQNGSPASLLRYVD